MTTSKLKTTTAGKPTDPGAAAGTKGKVKLNPTAVWVGGGMILLIAGGVAWYLMKKKKGTKITVGNNLVSRTAGRATNVPVAAGFRCTSSSYPLAYGTCHPDVMVLQRYLKSMNMNLGRSGKGRDGVDGQFGPLTRSAAQKQLGKDSFEKSDIEGMKKALTFVGK